MPKLIFESAEESIGTSIAKSVSQSVSQSVSLTTHKSLFLSLTLSLTLFTFLYGCASTSSSSKKQTSLVNISLSKDIQKMQGSSIPADETETFSSEDEHAVIWLKLQDVFDKHTLRWEWYDPKGNLYDTTDEYPINEDGRLRSSNTYWHKIGIKGEDSASLTGKWKVKVYLDKSLLTTKEFNIIEEGFNLFKYISKGPKVKIKPDRNKWALIIGIEKYKKTVPVQYAEKDANLMKEYLTKFIGVPEENTITLTNDGATKAEIDVLIKDRLKGLLKEGDTLYIYYSGHGIPADETPYLLPYDGDPESPAITAYPVEMLYKDLDRLPAKEIYVFMDSCFSGKSGRVEKEELLVAGVRPGVLKVKDPLLLSKKLVVLAAAKSNQLSNYYKQEGQGLFTYYLLKGMTGEADSNKDKKITLSELSKYVEEEVSSASRRLFGISRQQNPVVMPTPLGEREGLSIADVLR